MRSIIRGLGVLGTALGLAACAAAQRPATLADVEAFKSLLALERKDTSSGLKAAGFDAEFARLAASKLPRCFGGPPGLLRPVQMDLVAAVAANGEIKDVAVLPLNEQTVCVRDALRSGRLATAPGAPHYARLWFGGDLKMPDYDKPVLPLGFALADTRLRCADVVPPKLIRGEGPQPPPELRASNFEGRATLRISVGADGAVTKVDVLSSNSERWSAAAREAALRWEYEPARCDGKPAAAVLESALFLSFAR